MKLNRTWAMAVAIVMALTLSLSGTLAYLSDTDQDVNVMTLGNVQIEQLEYQRAEGVEHTATANEGDLVPFVQGQPLYPAVPKAGAKNPYTAEPTALFSWGPYVTAEGAGNGLWDDDKISNVVDKFVFVKNTGKSDAYYRTLFAFECPDGMEYGEGSDKEFMMNVNGNERFDWADYGYITVNGVRYLLMSATYKEILAPGEISRPSLLQVLMTEHCTNEHMELLGDSYEILVVTQAVQAAGFEGTLEKFAAEVALDAAFGPVSADSHPWMDGQSGDQKPDGDIINVSDVEGLKTAINNANKPTTIILADGTYDSGSEVIHVSSSKEITLNGSKNAIVNSVFMVSGKLNINGVTVKLDSTSNQVSQFSKSAIGLQSAGKVNCTNVTFDINLTDGTAITAWWSTQDGANIVAKNCVFNCNGNRPIRSDACVTVENCTFNDPYRYAVQMTSKSSTMDVDADAYVNFYNNTINAGTTSTKPVYGIQLEGGYGCSDLTINGKGNMINLGDTGKEFAMYYCECGAGEIDDDTIVWNTEVDPKHEI